MKRLSRLSVDEPLILRQITAYCTKWNEMTASGTKPAVSKRKTRRSSSAQISVNTHDINFILLLQEKAKERQTTICFISEVCTQLSALAYKRKCADRTLIDRCQLTHVHAYTHSVLRARQKELHNKSRRPARTAPII